MKKRVAVCLLVLSFTIRLAGVPAHAAERASPSGEVLPLVDLAAALAEDSTSARRDSAIGKIFEGWIDVTDVEAINEHGVTASGSSFWGAREKEEPGTFVIICSLPNTNFQINLFTTDKARAMLLNRGNRVKVRGLFEKHETVTSAFHRINAPPDIISVAVMRNVEIIEIEKAKTKGRSK